MQRDDEKKVPAPSSPDLLQKFPAEYSTCPKHGIPYPKGASCPECARERLVK